MSLVHSFSAAVRPGYRTLSLVVLGTMWLVANSRIESWSTLDFPLGLLALIAGTASLLIPHNDPYPERDEDNDFCLKDELFSVTIATILTMVGFQVMDF